MDGSAPRRRAAAIASHLVAGDDWNLPPPVHEQDADAKWKMGQASIGEDVSPARALSYHLMHPGGTSSPGDPNAAFCLDGIYHMHYIIEHPFAGATAAGTKAAGASFSFAHVISTDMLHWEWQTTKLQPSFTGHGMFSGTGFETKEGLPAAIYHGQASGRNQIAVAVDRQISAWNKPQVHAAPNSLEPFMFNTNFVSLNTTFSQRLCFS